MPDRYSSAPAPDLLCHASEAVRWLVWVRALSLIISALSFFFAGTDARSSSAQARSDAGLCDIAAQKASRRSGVPLDVLRAITRTETGRPAKGVLQPWPWTVNMEGAGHWFDDEIKARRYVEQQFSRGARSFDVGCFQINHRWHGAAFRNFEEMFDPQRNADYAARFLSELHEEFGDWTRAAGAYHSRTRQYAKRYEDRFDRILGRLSAMATTRELRSEAEFGPPQALNLDRRLVPVLFDTGNGRTPQMNVRPSGIMGSLAPLGSSVRAFIALD